MHLQNCQQSVKKMVMLAFMVPVLGICVSKQKMVENWRYKDGEDGAPSCGSYHG